MATHNGSSGSDTITVTKRGIMCIVSPVNPYLFTWVQPKGYIIGATAGFVTPSGAFDDITLTIHAGNGHDRIDLSGLTSVAGMVSVLVNGDEGDDTVFGSFFADVLNGGAGKDNLSGGEGDDQINGGTGEDILSGGFGIDTILGGDGADRIKGDAGNDILSGESDDDQLSGGVDDDTIYGGDGKDSLSGDQGNDKLYGGPGNDAVTGGDGNDWLYGDVGNDDLQGTNGIDRLFGESGNDFLHGGKGYDELSGGQGRDAFSFYNRNEERDVITDFDPTLLTGDYFAVSSLGFATIGGPGVLSPERFRMGTAATTSSHRFLYDPSSGQVFFDPDGIGSGAQVAIAQITASLVLSNNHFQVI